MTKLHWMQSVVNMEMLFFYFYNIHINLLNNGISMHM